MQSKIQNPKSKIARPYTALAEGYETVMAHVDYRRWAGYAHDLLQEHAPAAWHQGHDLRPPLGPRRLLELGCGTGALARWLQPRGPYRYLATDRSEAMLAVARRKARAESLSIRFRPADFTRIADDLPEEEPLFDAALLLYDGLNYLLKKKRISRVLEGAARVLRPGGLFLFDHSTPINSVDPTVFEDDGAFERPDGRIVRYRRESRYDPARDLHETVFEFDGPSGCHVERHQQRPYSTDQIRRLLHASPLEVLAAHDGFTTDPPADQSRRVHWLARLRM